MSPFTLFKFTVNIKILIKILNLCVSADSSNSSVDRGFNGNGIRESVRYGIGNYITLFNLVFLGLPVRQFSCII